MPRVLWLAMTACADALTDGLMIIRAMLGLTGTSVTNGAIGNGATRTAWAQIQPFVSSIALDVDGDKNLDALTDGLIIIRSMLGLTGTSVTNGAIGNGAMRTTWAQIQPYLNTNCGTNFAQ